MDDEPLIDVLPEGSLFSGPWPARLPVLLSSPHSGQEFGAEFLRFSLLPIEALGALDDGPVDRLLRGCVAAGAPLVHARFARAVVDLNRAPTECLPFLLERPGSRPVEVTARSRAGLGVVPTRIGVDAIYDKALPEAELSWRIDRLHGLHHRFLHACHKHISRLFGEALLLDVHSMPDSVAKSNGRMIDVAIGDCRGVSAPRQIVEAIGDWLSGHGLRTALNAPYSGGYVSQRHGRPAQGLPAVQLEIRRSLFMDGDHRLTDGASKISAHLEALVAMLSPLVEARGVRSRASAA